MNKPEIGKRQIIWKLPDGAYVMSKDDAHSNGYTRREAVPVPIKPTAVDGYRILAFEIVPPLYRLVLLTGAVPDLDGFECKDQAQLMDTISDLLDVAPLTIFKVEVV